MTFVFLCSSLESDRDGVGDYTRNLAAALIKLGLNVELIAFNDRHISDFFSGIQPQNGVPVSVKRIPSTLSQKDRMLAVKKYIDEYKPDWVSLQFVPYAFQKKGLPFGLLHSLLQLKGNFKWQIMYHELWVGVDGRLTFKNRIVKYLQQYIIKNINAKLHPACITTSIPVYLEKLNSPKARLLPLFGNIPVRHISQKANSDYDIMNVLHFGTFTGYVSELKAQFEFVKRIATNENRAIRFNIIGSAGPHKEQALTLASEIFGELAVNFIGKLPAEDISLYMHKADIGISRASHLMYGKSGSTVAMLEHGLPVVLRGLPPEFKLIQQDNYIQKGQLLFSTDSTNKIPQKQLPDYNSVENIAKKLLGYLSP